MKKLFITTLMVISSNLFASNQAKKIELYEDPPITDCSFTVTWTDTSGTHTKNLSSATGSYSDCVKYVNSKLDLLRSWGYTIESYSITYGEDGWW